MDSAVAAIWLLRLLFLALLYAFLLAMVQVLVRDLRAGAREAAASLGRLVVVESSGDPPAGASFALGAVATVGRNVTNVVVCDDAYVSGEHAALICRGRLWYVEDLGSTNGTYVDGRIVEGSAPLAYGHELVVGGVRFRLERPLG